MRFLLLIIFAGGFLSFKGYEEYKVSANASSTPTLTKVADIENGKKLTNNYVKLDEHRALIGFCVYSASLKKHETKVRDSSTIEYIYYPVLSTEHPFSKKMAALISKYKSINNIPGNMFPELSDVSVLVKSERYKTYGSIPESIGVKKSLKGLVVNSINSLDSEEKSLIRSQFKGADFNKLVIIEENRTPSSTITAFGMMGGGIAIIICTFLFGFKGRD